MNAVGIHVEFRGTTNAQGVVNPETTIHGNIWEFKSPEGSGKHTISHQFSRANKQTDRHVIDLARCGIDDEEAISQAARRFHGKKCFTEMLIVTKDGTVYYYSLVE